MLKIKEIDKKDSMIDLEEFKKMNKKTKKKQKN